MMQAQTLPSLSRAEEISVGTLPNGISYYVVNNPSNKGYADFCLVSKSPVSVGTARRSLSDKAHLGKRSPYEFLASSGVGCHYKGLVSYLPESTRFDMRDVPVFNQAVADSTLMMVFDLAAACHGEQALVISGDIGSLKITERLQLFSIIAGSVEKNGAGQSYSWTPRDTMAFRVTFNPSRDLAMIRLIYSTERTSREYLNTSVPYITGGYADVLGAVISSRIRRTFRSRDIPLADVTFSYSSSADGPDDERYTVSVYTSAGKLTEATAAVADALGSLDKAGACRYELDDARRTLEERRIKVLPFTSNRAYVEKCVSSYLYGTDLASESVIGNIRSLGNLSGEKDLSLFNGFAKALLDSTRNLVLRYDVPGMPVDRDSLLSVFNGSWADASADSMRYSRTVPDRFAFKAPSSKTKLKSESADLVSGGKVWTFANGMKVVFRKNASEKGFRYALMIRGGYGDVPGIEDGEGDFVGDMLSICDVAGLGREEFDAVLKSRGITMKREVTLTDLRICGSAHKSEVPFLLDALLAIANERKVNNGEYVKYRQDKAVSALMPSLYPRDVNGIMDGIAVPDFHRTAAFDPSGLPDDFPARAERYFSSQFSKVNDGIIVLTGDLDEETLKKELSRHLGDFRVQKKYSSKPNMKSSLAVRDSRETVMSSHGLIGGAERGAWMRLGADIDFNLSNYMAFRVAESVFRDALVKEMGECGAYVDVEAKFELFPRERFTIYASGHPCFADGLPEGIRPGDPEEIAEAMKRVVSDLRDGSVDCSRVGNYKSILMDRVRKENGMPETVVDNVMTRYSLGKDMVTGLDAAVNSVTADKVKGILRSMAGQSVIQYVIL